MPSPSGPEPAPDAGAGFDEASARERLARQLAWAGPRWQDDIRAHGEATKRAYAPLLAAAPRDGVRIERDLPYGPHPRQRLDVFAPPDAGSRPVVVFVHGGAFVRGDKSQPGEPGGLYDNVPLWFARHGHVGVNVEYRRAPEATYPAGIDDVAAALAWVVANVGRHGGDARVVHLIGHSAGGTHAAGYVFDPAGGHLGRDVTSLVLISARLSADDSPRNPNADGVRAYFGADASLYARRSPMAHAGAGALPVLVAFAEHDNPLLDVYALEFAQRLAAARGAAPRVVQMAGHNHVSIVAHFNTGEERLGREILAFFERSARARAD